MEIFRFRKFEVRNEKSAMKVNTDGVLLGALMTVTGDERRLLDIGTGTGTIALMAAQRLSAKDFGSKDIDSRSIRNNCFGGDNIDRESFDSKGFDVYGIDIDEDSAGEAAMNFAASPWAESLHARRCPLSGFRPEAPLDLIFSNPPFFTETLHSPSERKSRARHADSLPVEEIVGFAARHLSRRGRLSLILPAGQETETARTAAAGGLRLFRCVSVRASDRKPPYRVIMEFSRDAGQNAGASRETVTINMNGKYSEQYLDIVSDFLLLGKA